MTLLENWRNKAYGDATDDRQKEEIWKNYFIVEKGIYEKILKNPKDVIKCTVAELATKSRLPSKYYESSDVLFF